MPRRTLLGLLATIAVLAVPTAVGAAPYSHQPNATATGSGGAAATVDSVATSAATDVLRRGGNAVDAAVAAAAVLGVTEPFSCGIGGGGFMVIRTPHGKITTIDSREESPAAMRPDSFFENGAVLNFENARWSGLSAGVPGTVAGWEDALRKHGSWSMRRVLAPAIDVAREGFVVDETFRSQTRPNIPWFDDIPSTAALYLDPDRTERELGYVLRNPDMAKTYERIARYGAERGFYRGAVAEAMADAAQHPPTGPGADKFWRPGLMTERDIKDYDALKRKPTHVRYRGLDVFGMGPPSSGGSTDGEALNILERERIGDMSRIDQLHWFLEASRFSFADRGAYLADPEFFDVPLRGLLSDSFAAERHALISPDTRGDEPRRPRQPVRRPRRSRGCGHVPLADAVDDPPHRRRQARHGRLVHVHDRVDRRQRDRRARLGVPAQQRADRLRHRLADAPEQGRRAQAAALVDGADDRARRRQAVPGHRLARRLDDHHDGAAGPDRADRRRQDAAGGDRRAARQPAQHRADGRGAGVPHAVRDRA